LHLADGLGKKKHFFPDNVLGAFRLVFPRFQVFLHHLAEVVDVVGIHAVQVGNRWVHIPGHGDVDEKNGPMPSRLLGRGHHLVCDDVAGLGCGRQHDVDVFQQVRQFRKLATGTPEGFGELHGSVQGSVGHQEVGAFFHKMAGRQFAHVASSHQHTVQSGQIAKNLARQFHCRVAHAHRRFGDPGFRTHPLGHGKRPVKAAIQIGAGGLFGGGLEKRLLDLSQDLGLAHHQRIQGSTHPEEMAQGVFPHQPVEVGLQKAVFEFVKCV
jgi:hypothetical protein